MPEEGEQEHTGEIEKCHEKCQQQVHNKPRAQRPEKYTPPPRTARTIMKFVFGSGEAVSWVCLCLCAAQGTYPHPHKHLEAGSRHREKGVPKERYKKRRTAAKGGEQGAPPFNFFMNFLKFNFGSGSGTGSAESARLAAPCCQCRSHGCSLLLPLPLPLRPRAAPNTPHPRGASVSE